MKHLFTIKCKVKDLVNTLREIKDLNEMVVNLKSSIESNSTNE